MILPFPEMVNRRHVRNWMSGTSGGRQLKQAAATSAVKLVLITNATMFHRPNGAYPGLYDQYNGEIWAKLDAGTETIIK